MSYQEFIDGKHFRSIDAGFTHQCSESWLFDYQKACVELQMGRKFIGTELKESYFKLAARNLADAESVQQCDLFGD